MKNNYLKYTIPITILSIIGLLTIYLSKNIITDSYSYFYRQTIYIIIGFITLFILKKININILKKYSLLLYVFSIFMLIYVLIFGTRINGSKSWINIFGLSFQPSEFVKINLLLCFNNYINTKYGILKCLLLLLLPSILTFMQPDTGTVLFYLIIFFSILLSLKIKKKYYIGIFSLIILSISIYFYLYFFNSDLFINIFGTSFFYRTDRIINFMNNEGYQLNNALIGIGTGGLIGNYNKYVIYIPEVITDFMFANTIIKFGFIGSLIIIINFIIIDLNLIKDIKNNKDNKMFIIGLFGLFLYQQIQHIFMNIGLLPITGITLPFISYGGSSLISYFILFGILFNIKEYQS